jgi:hypothetical protein
MDCKMGAQFSGGSSGIYENLDMLPDLLNVSNTKQEW